jgi:CTP:molybdopterin cytidylyltransferase MocA
MGTTKALLPWGATTLLTAWIARLTDAGVSPIAVVLGDNANLVRRAVREELPEEADVIWVVNPNIGGTGPRESLLLGLDALPADRPAWFTPVDVPPADEGTLRTMSAAWDRALADREVEPLAALPMYRDEPGHPVLAGPAFIARLFQGEPGDRIDELLQWATRRLVRVSVETPNVLADMNSPADYRGHAPTGDFSDDETVPPQDLAGETLPPS